MRRALIWTAVLITVAVAALLATLPSDPPAPRTARAPHDPFKTNVQPLLKTYCYKCHRPDGEEFDMTVFRSTADVERGRELWREALTKLHTREMPPEEEPQPTPDERDRITDWLEGLISRLEYGGPPDPGRVTLRRLNRAEYNNTIRDLVGIDFAPAADFPSDDVGYGFDNIGDVLSMPPMLMEKYLAAARTILDRAIVTPGERKPVVRRFEAAGMAQTRGSAVSGNQRVLFAEGEIYTRVRIPKDGKYLLRAMAEADQAGPEIARMELRVDRKAVKAFDVKAPRGKPEAYEHRLTLKAGRRRIGAAFTNDYYRPNEKNPNDRDRNLIVYFVELVGPFVAVAPEREASHARIFGEKLEARTIVERFAARAWRRPVAEEETDRLMVLLDMALVQGDAFEAAMKVPLQAVLVSPHFLFRVEADTDGIRELDGYELAARLSYFIWSSMPDAELFARAGDGTLRDPDVLDAQVQRMLKDPKASALAENFAPQWLQIRRLESATPDPQLFPEYSPALRAAMLREAVMFFEAILREDRAVLEFLDADFTFVNEPLARLYGIEGVTGPEMRRVTLSDPRRGGVMTMAAVLTATSNPTRTSAVKRGKWVLEAILGTPPPPPLPDAGTLDVDADDPHDEEISLRKRLERHRQDPNCISCHQRMDPIGFGFENYNAVGVWRDSMGGKPIDTSAVFPDGRSFSGPVELKRLLLSDERQIVHAFTEQLMTYALGRGMEFEDGPTIRAIVKALEHDGYRVSSLVIEIAKSYPFRYRRGSS